MWHPVQKKSKKLEISKPKRVLGSSSRLALYLLLFHLMIECSWTLASSNHVGCQTNSFFSNIYSTKIRLLNSSDTLFDFEISSFLLFFRTGCHNVSWHSFARHYKYIYPYFFIYSSIIKCQKWNIIGSVNSFIGPFIMTDYQAFSIDEKQTNKIAWHVVIIKFWLISNWTFCINCHWQS